jgi:putative oligomerization/nucleic acid binding protein
MMRRRRPLLRAAAVGGGAYLAGKHMANKQADQQYQEADQDARLSSLEQQQQGGYGSYPPPQQAPPPPAAPPAAEPSMMDQLSQLADLHKQGVLTDDEFTAAKAKLLGT